jgi:two-component system sensor histidine kinase KdpD
MKQEQASAKRGKLKVYLGMAAGVGKTYGMLVEGLQELDRGTDVVIGYLEAHGRLETESLAQRIPALPPRLVEYRGVTLRELDVDAVLARKPALALVDELAHTNTEGSRHRKRWQDVEELLANGIDVTTTVNIQHIESLRDVVAQITGVYVQETVPDSFFKATYEIELVDIPPEQLQQRLRDGKVYGAGKVGQALEGFFKKSNLLALRELALRHTAEQVDRDLRQSRDALKEKNPWHASERILVCIAPNRMASRVVRAAKRLATSLHAELLAVTVESSRQRTVSASSRAHQEKAMSLAERVGAKSAHLAGDDIVAEVISYAQRENVTTIVMGKPVRPRWKELLFGSVVDATIRASGGIDILVITGAEAQGTELQRRPTQDRRPFLGYVEAALVVALCTAIGFIIHGVFQLSNLVMLYLLGAVLISLRNGIRESIFATLLSICAFNFCFVPPRFTFSVADFRYIFTFGVMGVVSVILSLLTSRLRESSVAVSVRERTTATLYDLSKRLAVSRKVDHMARLGANKVTEILALPSAVFGLTGGSVEVLAPSKSKFEDDPKELAVVGWVVDNNQAAGRETDTLVGSRGYYVPLSASNGVYGSLGVDLQESAMLDLSQKRLIDAVASQLAGAFERARFAKESHNAALKSESEKLRSDLLSAVSHDLRTPLASIGGSAASLLNQPELSPVSQELATAIQEESSRMEGLIRNLLDMTRVQGEVRLDLDWQSLGDLIANAVERTSTLMGQAVEVQEPKEQVLVQVDGVLVEQVIVNLLENAAHHAGPNASVSVTLAKADTFVSIEVTDDGPGLAAGDEDRVFERFFHTGKSGFGLGLAICKAAVEAHGGTISAKNRNPGVSFLVVLPYQGRL